MKIQANSFNIFNQLSYFEKEDIFKQKILFFVTKSTLIDTFEGILYAEMNGFDETNLNSEKLHRCFHIANN